MLGCETRFVGAYGTFDRGYARAAGGVGGGGGNLGEFEVLGFGGSVVGKVGAATGTGGGGMSDELEGLLEARLAAAGETGRGAELEPAVDGRESEKIESVGEGGVCC